MGWREGKPLVGDPEAVTHGYFVETGDSEGIFFDSSHFSDTKKDSSGIPSLAKHNRGLPLQVAHKGLPFAPTHGYSDK